MRISDWSSDVCSSDLRGLNLAPTAATAGRAAPGSGKDVELALRGHSHSDLKAGATTEVAPARPNAACSLGCSHLLLARTARKTMDRVGLEALEDRKSTRQNSSH